MSGKSPNTGTQVQLLTQAWQSFSQIISELEIIQSGEHKTACCLAEIIKDIGDVNEILGVSGGF